MELAGSACALQRTFKCLTLELLLQRLRLERIRSTALVAKVVFARDPSFSQTPLLIGCIQLTPQRPLLRRQLALGAEGRANVAQQAELFGRVRPAGAGGPEVTTLGGQQAALQEELARSADVRAGRAQESELFGKVAGAGGPIETLGGMQALEGLEGSRMAREAAEAGLTGQYEGGATVQEQNRLDALKTQDLQRRLATAGATGELDLGGSQQPVTTLQAQALEQEMQGQTLERALQRAGATGEFREEGDTGPAVDTLESRLRTAQLTGALGDKATLEGRQADMDLVGAILASQDPTLNVTEADKLKMTGIGGALASSLQAFGPAQRRAIQEALGYTPTGGGVGGNGAGNLGLFQDQGTGLVNPLTDNQRSQARNNPLGAIDEAAAGGGLTPGVLKDLPQETIDAFIAQAGDMDPELLRRLIGGA